MTDNKLTVKESKEKTISDFDNFKQVIGILKESLEKKELEFSFTKEGSGLSFKSFELAKAKLESKGIKREEYDKILSEILRLLNNVLRGKESKLAEVDSRKITEIKGFVSEDLKDKFSLGVTSKNEILAPNLNWEINTKLYENDKNIKEFKLKYITIQLTTLDIASGKPKSNRHVFSCTLGDINVLLRELSNIKEKFEEIQKTEF